MIEIPLRAHQVAPKPPEGGRFQGYRVIFDHERVVVTEDWSGVRSQGRARRREKRGFRQRVRRTRKPIMSVVNLGDTLVMHPAAWPKLVVKMALEADFQDRASRAGVDLKLAKTVRSLWAEERGFAQDCLRRTGVVRLRMGPKMDMSVHAAVPTNATYQAVDLTATLLSDGRLAVVFKGLVIDEISA